MGALDGNTVSLLPCENNIQIRAHNYAKKIIAAFIQELGL